MSVSTSDIYADNHGRYCPICKSTNLDKSGVVVDLNRITRECRCKSCSSFWTEEFFLEGFVNLRAINCKAA